MLFIFSLIYKTICIYFIFQRDSLLCIPIILFIGGGFLGLSYFLPGETEEFRELLRTVHFVGIMFLVCAPLFLFGYFFGKSYIPAAENRDLKKLKYLFYMWVGGDVVSVILVIIFLAVVVEMQVVLKLGTMLCIVSLITIPIGVFVEYRKIRFLWQFTQEVQSDTPYLEN